MQNKSYCTFFPDKLGDTDISQCCQAHDNAYELQIPKGQADKELFDCVRDSSGGIGIGLIAVLMFVGVSLFGHGFYKRAKVKE